MPQNATLPDDAVLAPVVVDARTTEGVAAFLLCGHIDPPQQYRNRPGRIPPTPTVLPRYERVRNRSAPKAAARTAQVRRPNARRLHLPRNVGTGTIKLNLTRSTLDRLGFPFRSARHA
jgi:hypothetical protein